MQAHWIEHGTAVAAAELDAQGIHHRRLPVDVAGFQGALDVLKRERGYVEQDVVALSPETPNLDAICAKFVDEHSHDEDEVRFVLSGDGIFDIRSRDDRWMRVRVEAGDLIVVPKDRFHRFMLTDTRAIRCVRLFKDASGWVPKYRAGPTG
jgi:1,2-dihydroxy-3-keto-5-methylthiopentene dioxygenase